MITVRPVVVDDWSYLPCPQDGPARRLFCFPHAGGDVTAFRGLAGALAPDAEVWAVRLPGRGGRYGEPLPARFEELADAVADGIGPHLRPGSVFYGQSFGALLGWEVARRLPAGRRPAALVAASARAPGAWAGTLPEGPQAAERLLELSGLGAGLAGHPEFRRQALATVGADLELCRGYRHHPGPVPEFDLHALTGTEDPEVLPGHLPAWADCTRGRFDWAVTEGGHLLATVDTTGPAGHLRSILRRQRPPSDL